MKLGLGEHSWHVLGSSVRGASHMRTESPNQDAIEFATAPNSRLPAIVVVSDGHGSERCFRSHYGSRIAVEVASETLGEFAAAVTGFSPQEIEIYKTNAEQRLPKKLVQCWVDRVKQHVREAPFTEDEGTKLGNLLDGRAEHEAAFEHRTLVAYGATLVAVLLCDKFLLCLQLGDGEILTVSGTTCEVDSPLVADVDLIANETTSLCQEDAWKRFRFRFKYFDSPPALILLATDGYPNSFQSPEGFRQVASDLHDMLVKDGVARIAEQLPTWLADASREGSGDDVTLGLIYCEHTSLRGTPKTSLPEDPAAEGVDAPNLVAPTPTTELGSMLTLVGVLRQPFRFLRQWFRKQPSAAVLFAAAVLVPAFDGQPFPLSTLNTTIAPHDALTIKSFEY